LPFFTRPKPRRRCAVVGNFTSDVSWMASTCRPAAAGPVDRPQSSTILSAVTFSLAKNRPKRNSPPRSPPRRRRQTVLRRVMRSRMLAPTLSSRTSPNDPSDQSIAVGVLRLPKSTESYRVACTQRFSKTSLYATRDVSIPLNYPLIFPESFQWGSIACPAITRLSSPGGTPRTACRVVTWQAHEQQGESGRIEACQPEVMCQSQMRGVLRGPGACCRAWTGSLPRPCHEPKPHGCSTLDIDELR